MGRSWRCTLPQPEGISPLIGPGATARRLPWLLAAGLLLALALGKFVFEDALRLAFPANDLTSPWISSQLFLHGQNPYGDAREFARIWAASGVSSRSSGANSDFVLSTYGRVYPPTTILLIAPLGLLGWHTAVYTYFFGSTALFILALLVLAQQLPLPRLDPRKLYFAAFALAMAPLHSGIHEVNLNTVIVACLCAGAAFLSTRPYCSGIAIAIAVCLKPQVGIFFFAYPWLRKKWKTAFAALGACSVISASSLVWMKIHHIEWLGGFLNELSRFSSSYRRSSPNAAGAGRFQLLNLQVLTFQFTHSPEWSKILAWTLFALLAGVSGFLIISRVSDKNESTGIAMISILTLLPVYQHYYAAEILLFVLYWAIENWRAKRRKGSAPADVAAACSVRHMGRKGRRRQLVHRRTQFEPELHLEWVFDASRHLDRADSASHRVGQFLPAGPHACRACSRR